MSKGLIHFLELKSRTFGSKLRRSLRNRSEKMQFVVDENSRKKLNSKQPRRMGYLDRRALKPQAHTATLMYIRSIRTEDSVKSLETALDSASGASLLPLASKMDGKED